MDLLVDFILKFHFLNAFCDSDPLDLLVDFIQTHFPNAVVALLVDLPVEKAPYM